jgi:predicted ATPase/DNA-binding XRE family transcriptional regulator
MYELSFGEWLSQRRKAFGLTQNELAEKIYCAVITLRKIEAGERRPSAQIAERIGQILGVPLSDQNAFLHFARGEWQSTPALEPVPYQWEILKPITQYPVHLNRNAFVGRSREIIEVSRYLTDTDAQLITLVGAPGVGKSRLSNEVIRKLGPEFPDGISAVSLADLSDPNVLQATLLQAIGMNTTAELYHISQPNSETPKKRMLLVLDNVEHLISFLGPLVYQLLRAFPDMKILATSREPLHIAGEVIYSLSPLELPDERQKRLMDVELIRQNSALKLFEECARTFQPDFAISSENVNEVTAICERLDGLPLAIEVVASRIRLMTPQSLLAHLTSQFMLQSTGPGYLPAYHKTLERAIDRSYTLLSLEEKRLFTYLSVFNGFFTLEMVETAFSATPPHNIIADLMSSLLEKSLIQPVSIKRGEPHFGLLNIIQQYAADHLKDFDQDAVARLHFPPVFPSYSTSVQINHPQRD